MSGDGGNGNDNWATTYDSPTAPGHYDDSPYFGSDGKHGSSWNTGYDCGNAHGSNGAHGGHDTDPLIGAALNFNLLGGGHSSGDGHTLLGAQLSAELGGHDGSHAYGPECYDPNVALNVHSDLCQSHLANIDVHGGLDVLHDVLPLDVGVYAHVHI